MTYSDTLNYLTETIIDYYSACGRESYASALDAMMDSAPWTAHCAGDHSRCGHLALVELGDWSLHHGDADDIGMAWGRAVEALTGRVLAA